MRFSDRVKWDAIADGADAVTSSGGVLTVSRLAAGGFGSLPGGRRLPLLHETQTVCRAWRSETSRRPPPGCRPPHRARRAGSGERWRVWSSVAPAGRRHTARRCVGQTTWSPISRPRPCPSGDVSGQRLSTLPPSASIHHSVSPLASRLPWPTPSRCTTSSGSWLSHSSSPVAASRAKIPSKSAGATKQLAAIVDAGIQIAIEMRRALVRPSGAAFLARG